MRIFAAAVAAVVATGAGLVLTSSHASAQSSPDAPPQATASTDHVTVTAPRYHQRKEFYNLNVPPENVSLSQPVSITDLDLRTSHGARELRRRVRMAADQVCRQLVEAVPHGLDSSRSCYRDAVAEAQPQVDAAIQNARSHPPGLYGHGGN